MPVEPQPEATEIVTVRRYYTKHSNSPAYERRVTWIDEESDSNRLALYEYRGDFPGASPHGVAQKNISEPSLP